MLITLIGVSVLLALTNVSYLITSKKSNSRRTETPQGGSGTGDEGVRYVKGAARFFVVGSKNTIREQIHATIDCRLS